MAPATACLIASLLPSSRRTPGVNPSPEKWASHAGPALGLAAPLRIAPGDLALLMVLAASASYIAVPAVLRYAIPEANPSLYFGMSLGITFPLNILFGIPLYMNVAHAVLG